MPQTPDVMNRVVRLLPNGTQEAKEAVYQSKGALSEGEVTGLGKDGKLHVSVMPDGIGEPTLAVIGTESIGAGKYVNVFDDAGTMKFRLADAAKGKVANGFLSSAFTFDALEPDATATVHLGGRNSIAGLTVGTRYFLGEDGEVTTDIRYADVTDGAEPPNVLEERFKFVQTLGRALNGGLHFVPDQVVKLG